MSRENVEEVRAMYALFNERRLDEWLERFDPELEWHPRADEPDASTRHGRQGLRDLIDTWISSFPDLRVEAEEFIDVGDRVVAVTRLVGSGGESGIPVNDVYVFMHRFGEAGIIETREYRSKTEALEALEHQE